MRHAEPIVRLVCATVVDGIAGVQVGEESFIVLTAELRGRTGRGGDRRLGRRGRCACRTSASESHVAATVPDATAFERTLRDRWR